MAELSTVARWALTVKADQEITSSSYVDTSGAILAQPVVASELTLITIAACSSACNEDGHVVDQVVVVATLAGISAAQKRIHVIAGERIVSYQNQDKSLRKLISR